MGRQHPNRGTPKPLCQWCKINRVKLHKHKTCSPSCGAALAWGTYVGGSGADTLSTFAVDATGAPWAWAGRHRLAPEALGDSIDARTSGYYVVLETRRHSAGRVVVASVEPLATRKWGPIAA